MSILCLSCGVGPTSVLTCRDFVIPSFPFKLEASHNETRHRAAAPVANCCKLLQIRSALDPEPPDPAGRRLLGAAYLAPGEERSERCMTLRVILVVGTSRPRFLFGAGAPRGGEATR